ncbi:DUF4873 domain-containing protein [Couchioplanes azureus]|uniref:DUF4873 domain-containing protein n=1 Tax=Couchioplanes caeruleus TaxID=56438 RepID=UPI00166FD91F|nr:DUF4873 domain-containing protein [Couchioplanes caeruleus]GGQ74198.1 DUF4873 domain-containing protein [Couchioplanes caeruleus subsp. azureus]
MSDADEEYRGEAEIRAGETAVTVTVRLSAQFEPVEGRYRWAGRAAPDDTLSAQLRAGARDVTVRVGGREAAARLGEPDPWGGVRLTGLGRPPWSADAGA